MPVIQVDMFSGRTTEMKRQLVKALTDAFVEVTGARPQSVQIILRDVKSMIGAWADPCAAMHSRRHRHRAPGL